MSPLVVVENLSKSFGSKKALDNISFELNKGEPIALVGPNGAGKTTLFSILCGYIQPSVGKVAILGQSPSHPANFGRLSALPQDALLDPNFSVGQQLKFYGELQGLSGKELLHEVLRVLELVGLADLFNEKPNALSHGMRKRVAIAQALLGSPEIVLLDEATAGLDPKHARDIRQIIASLSDQITFLLSSHDLFELEQLCHQVLYLEHGQLKQHHVGNGAEPSRYFTLRMEQTYPDIVQMLTSLNGVISVEQGLNKELVIRTQADVASAIDIKILELCYQHQWQYRQLINGKTLENQLF